MKPDAAALNVLRTTRARAKMYEFAVPPALHNNLPINPDTLFSLAIGLVGDAAAQINAAREGRETELDAIQFAARFFDAFLDARLDDRVKQEFTLLGSAAYYLADMPGNARVLVSRMDAPNLDGADGLDRLTFQLLLSDYQTTDDDYAANVSHAGLRDELEAYLRAESGPEGIIQAADYLRSDAYDGGDSRSILYADLVGAIVRKKIGTASRTVLPETSGIDLDAWRPALANSSFMQEFWPAQMRIAEAGILRGRSAVVQMPTSAGKTRATELIIRSAFLSERTALAVIVSPFRALCHDIRGDLVKAFAGENVGVNEATDAFQFDLSFEEFMGHKTILIVTPEKLLYLLRRTPELAEQIGLIIYDEGHQFDNPKRGATYELLLTSLKLLLSRDTQTVLISAVIANAHEVAHWLVGHLDAVVRGDDLAPTIRSYAFATWATQLGQLRYVPKDDPNGFDFFVPRVIQSRTLTKRPRERTERVFPTKNDGPSIGLYLGLKLVQNGSIAVFCGRKDTAANLCATAVEIFARDYPPPTPLAVSDAQEVQKISHLFAEHTGEEAGAAQSSAIGIFPHHANVPQGLRLCVEHAMKEGLARFVICTSTLAQGVNLPIKYLIVTGVYQGRDRILVRDFHNLMGRAGRAGMHTEGSVIFAQNEIYDGKSARSTSWRWRTACDLLNPQNSEPSASSLSLLFEPHRFGLRGQRSASLNIRAAHTLVFDDRAQVDAILDSFMQANPADGDRSQFERYLRTRVGIIQAIAAFLVAHLNFQSASFADDADVLCSNTLAYHLATDEQRTALQSLFRNIAAYIAEQAPTDELRTSIRRSALSPMSVRALSEWVANNILAIRQAAQAGNLFAALAGQVMTHTRSDDLLSLSDPDAVVPLAEQWMEGATFVALHASLAAQGIQIGTRHPKVEAIVGLCESGFGFDGAMLFGTISDLVEGQDPELANEIAVVSKRLKYGLPGRGSIAFYEAGFADRIVAMRLAELFPLVTDRLTAIAAVRAQEPAARELLSAYPSFFGTVLSELVG
jgi:hypothetical protein